MNICIDYEYPYPVGLQQARGAATNETYQCRGIERQRFSAAVDQGRGHEGRRWREGWRLVWGTFWAKIVEESP